jgi:hypothetical protein
MVGIVCNVPKRLKRQKKLLRPKSGKARQYNRVIGCVASYPQFRGAE